MNPQPWFIVAGLLFILALIAGAALLVLVCAVALRFVGLGLAYDHLHDDQHYHEPNRSVEADPAAVLGQLLADLAAHQQQRYRRQAKWDQVDWPPVVEVTDIRRNPPRGAR